MKAASALHSIHAVLFVLGFAIAGSAAAQTAPPSPGKGGDDRGARLFAMIDANKDGVISREEFAAFQAKRFAALDTNKDGVVSREEFMAAPMRRGGGQSAAQTGNQADPRADRQRANRERRFKELDKNGDGTLSLTEFQAGGKTFDLLDRNRDGKLTLEELRALRDEQQQRR